METTNYELALDAAMISQWEAEQAANLDGAAFEASMMDANIAKGGF